MTLLEIIVLFAVSHLGANDDLLQTDWQARHKRGGLGADPRARRALLSDSATYSLAFVPARIWVALVSKRQRPKARWIRCAARTNAHA
jgi:hypothetical protein